MTRAMLRDYIERWAPRAFVFATLLAILFFLASLVVMYVWGRVRLGCVRRAKRSFTTNVFGAYGEHL